MKKLLLGLAAVFTGLMLSAEPAINARVDIYHQNGKNCDLTVLEKSEGVSAVNPAWMKTGDKGGGVTAILPTSNEWQEATLKFKVAGDGLLNFRLVFTDAKDKDGKPVIAKIEYQSVTVNGKELIAADKAPVVSFFGNGKGVAYTADDGDELTIKIKSRRAAE